MKRIQLLSFCLLIFTAFSLKADVVTPGETQRAFTIINLEDFSDYEFYFRQSTYFYDQGYQQGDDLEVVFKANEHYRGGRDSDRSSIFATKNGDEQTVFQSDEMVGGMEVISDYDVYYILDEIQIQSVKDGLVKFKVCKSYYVYGDGVKKKIRKGMIGIGGPWYLVFAGIAALVLIAFFIFRRKGEFEE